jgi:hypothetical protein
MKHEIDKTFKEIDRKTTKICMIVTVFSLVLFFISFPKFENGQNKFWAISFFLSIALFIGSCITGIITSHKRLSKFQCKSCNSAIAEWELDKETDEFVFTCQKCEIIWHTEIYSSTD